MALSVDKAAIRSEVRARLQAMTLAERAQADAAIVTILRRYLSARDGDVLAYAALHDEVDLRTLLDELAAQGRLLLPRVRGHEIEVYRVRDVKLELETGKFGIMEPKTIGDSEPSEPAIVLVPGRAFDGFGARVGRGGGYYDRALSGWANAVRVGVAYEVQRFDRLRSEPHDQRVAALVTQRGWYDVDTLG